MTTDFNVPSRHSGSRTAAPMYHHSSEPVLPRPGLDACDGSELLQRLRASPMCLLVPLLPFLEAPRCAFDQDLFEPSRRSGDDKRIHPVDQMTGPPGVKPQSDIMNIFISRHLFRPGSLG